MDRREILKLMAASLIDGHDVTLEQLLSGEGDWFQYVDDSIIGLWEQLSVDAKAVAYLWAVTSEEADSAYLDSKFSER